jgi:dipeptidase E
MASVADRHIVAMGGGGFSTEGPDSAVDRFVLRLTGKRRPRVCFLPTATGSVPTYVVNFYDAFRRRAEPSHLDLFVRTQADLRATILEQDVVYVGGGNTANLLAIWRVHGLDTLLAEAWARGVVLAGVSAGAICWFEAGVTDSFGPQLAPLGGGLGLLPGSFCPHYDGEALRRPTFQRLVSDGTLPAGWAADDGAGLHFVGTELREVVASRRDASGYRVERGPGGAVERRLEARLLR